MDIQNPDQKTQDALAHNLAWWEERAALHPDTGMYQGYIQALVEGGHCLYPLERDAVGDVQGKRLVHLQCHIGTDTLSWSRLGAQVTGVDFSPTALAQAQALQQRLGLDAEWVQSPIDEVPERLPAEAFDIAFSSYGVVNWLPDLDRWARSIAHCLTPGGFYFIADGHPMLFTLDEQSETEEEGPRLVYPYFNPGGPRIYEEAGSYADREAETAANFTGEWFHPLSEIVTALLGAGLVLEAFGEHQACPWQALPCATRHEDGLYRLPEWLRDRIPLLFSLKVRKPGGQP